MPPLSVTLHSERFEDMTENLVIVESPAKARTIEKFLGKEHFTVKSSYGHIRDLNEKKLSIDKKRGFEPQYEVVPGKKKLVAELKAAAEKAGTVWLASDEDREGEAISWHLYEVLGLTAQKSKRIAFHEITETALKEALAHPREIDMDLVMAQQARRVIDRLVGYELSPVLWKKVQRGLSAGRVQSVALRLVVDREREINAFQPKRFFRVEGTFTPEKSSAHIKALLDTRFDSEEEAKDFLEKCRLSSFAVNGLEKKKGTHTPAAPFTTSMLQQEAARKLGFSVKQTMSVAQQLYEKGLITYMRTDSTNLSSLAINTAKETIINLYGEKYSKVRHYKTKVKGAQEAHEAIRPTYIRNTEIEGTANEKRLYNLIWKRTIASQMADAQVERTTLSISGSGISERFEAEGEQILFDGFLKVYIESRDDEEEKALSTLPNLTDGLPLNRNEITATEHFTQRPSRYSEATLVKKLEELEIGRPSTYAPTIDTITTRGYISKGDRPGTERRIIQFSLKKDSISRGENVEKTGAEKKKLFPENIGIVITDYLTSHFKDIVDYGFTARVEDGFDKIAAGKIVWNKLIDNFYGPFAKTVSSALEDTGYSNSERILGNDPQSGKVIIARIGPYGPMVQKGDKDDPQKQYASMAKGQLIETITLEDALHLFILPREVGTFEGKTVTAAIGKYGPYIKFDGKFISLGKNLSPYTVTEQEAGELISAYRDKESSRVIASFPNSDIQVLNGRYGPYIKQGSKNYKIPKSIDAKSLTESDCLKIIADS